VTTSRRAYDSAWRAGRAGSCGRLNVGAKGRVAVVGALADGPEEGEGRLALELAVSFCQVVVGPALATVEAASGPRVALGEEIGEPDVPGSADGRVPRFRSPATVGEFCGAGGRTLDSVRGTLGTEIVGVWCQMIGSVIFAGCGARTL
jgi:hypothetical protein